jgi:hypothetical protein
LKKWQPIKSDGSVKDAVTFKEIPNAEEVAKRTEQDMRTLH